MEEIKIKNWKIIESKNGFNDIVYVVYETLICNFEDNTKDYYHQTFLTLKSALNYIADRI